MVELISAGGPFAIVILILGVAAIILSILQLVRRERNDAALIIALTAATFLLAALAYSMGMWEAFQLAKTLAPEKATYTMALAQGVASTVLVIGAGLGCVSSLVGGVAIARRHS